MAEEQTLNFRIGNLNQPQKLYDFLISKYKAFNLLPVKQILNEQRILVNGEISDENSLVRPNDLITYKHSKKYETTPEPQFKILFEDENLLVVSKDNCVPVTPISFTYFNCLTIFLREELKQNELSPANRLDIETTGIILFSKDKSFTSLLHKELFLKNKILKEYFCVCFGKAGFDEITVKGNIFNAGKSKIFTKLSFEANENGNSETKFKVLQGSEILKVREILGFEKEGNFEFLKAIPITGKTNQIRVHASFCGLPIVGDKKYFPDENIYLEWFKEGFTEKVAEKLVSKRQLLHCFKTEFVHPLTKEKLCFVSN
ncbi:RluA family pseudouridine synthase [bacterium]|nr:RluA family pseudouridine synthase [bacterium]